MDNDEYWCSGKVEFSENNDLGFGKSPMEPQKGRFEEEEEREEKEERSQQRLDVVRGQVKEEEMVEVQEKEVCGWVEKKDKGEH